MSVKLWEAASVNAFSTTLNGSINDSDTTITLTTTTNLVAPGVLVIDRQDSSGTNTPALREYITFTGISSNDLTGVSRNVAGSTAQSHSSGAIIEENMSVTHWNDLADFLQVSHDSAGNIVASTATIATARIYTHLNASGASFTISNIRIPTDLNASGASITGDFPINPVWVFTASASTPTTGVGVPISLPQSGEFKFFSAVLNSPASGAAMILDINNNNTSIFEAGTRLTIPAGGTYASTASINTKIFNPGNIIDVDIDSMSQIVNNLSVTVSGRGG